MLERLKTDLRTYKTITNKRMKVKQNESPKEREIKSLILDR